MNFFQWSHSNLSALLVAMFALGLGVGCAPVGVTVEWTTATETHTAGFYLYRADSADGSYVRVNKQIIPSSADPLNGGKYQYLDITADPSHTYYYKLEEVQDDGHTTLYGPIRVESDSGSGLYLWLIVGLSIVLISALFYVFRRHAP